MNQIVLRRLLREACSIRRSTLSATAPCKTTMSNSKVQPGWGFPHPYPPRGHASAAGRPQIDPVDPRFPIPLASGRVLKKNIGPNLAPRRPQDRRLKRFFPILDPSWPKIVDLGPILAPTSYNIVQARRQDAPTIPNYDSQTIKNLQKPMVFFKVFGCTTHLPKWSKMLLKSAPGIPQNRTS